MVPLTKHFFKVPIRNILAGYAGLSAEGFVSAPSQFALRKTLFLAKSKITDKTPQPKSMNFEIPNIYTSLKFLNTSEPFSIIDSGVEDPKRILGFSTMALLRVLSKSLDIHGDGTFSTVPADTFYQLYSLHAKLSQDTLAPVAFYLLPDKTSQTYERMLRMTCDAYEGLVIAPQTFLVDFEKASFNAIEKVFPDCHISLCFFHLSQSINRQIIQLGLAMHYREDEDARFLINQLKVFLN